MNGLWNAVKWTLWLILAIVTLFAINLTCFLWRGPTPAQQAALELARAPVSRPDGRNAFALMRLFDKDVADEALDRLAEADVRFAEVNGHLGNALGKFPSERLSSLPALKPDSLLCQTQEGSCLALVRENDAAIRTEIAGHSHLLSHAIQLEEYDYLLDQFPRLANMPVAFAKGAQRLRLSSLALAYLDGRREEALVGTCHNISAWRRFGRGNPSLIHTMIAVNYRDASLRLFADMLAALNPEEAVPKECQSALAPPTAAEISSCAPMLGEFAFVEASLAQMNLATNGSERHSWLGSKSEAALLSSPQSRAWRASQLAVYCGQEAEVDARNDQPVDLSKNEIGLLECASNPIACILIQVPAPTYSDYDKRILDSAAHLRLAATLVWLREHQDDRRKAAIRFDERPARLRSGSRASGVAVDGRSIRVQNLYKERGEFFTLPLAIEAESKP